MARQAEIRGPRTLEMRKHAAAVAGTWRYLEWCEKHGFPASYDKTDKQIAIEQALHCDLQRKRDENARMHRNPRKLLEAICLGTLHSSDIERPHWKSFAINVERHKLRQKDRQSLFEFCLHILHGADFLLDATPAGSTGASYLSGLINLHARKHLWLRKLEDWKPPTHNADRQFHSLARHLLARYPVPIFFDQVWLLEGEAHDVRRDWYVHVGSGGNMRNATTPIPLTKMMAHHMMLAPDTFTMDAALRWGQIHALGGDAALTEAILATPLGNHFNHDDFWQSVIRFFVDNAMLDRRHVGPIIDYLNHQKFENRLVLDENNVMTTQPPAQPNLSMRGRTVDALLVQVDKWHRDLNRQTRVTGELFKPSGFQGFRMESSDEEGPVWMISELRSTAQLREEGSKMRHCVLSYAQSCVSGTNSIWTMELQNKLGIEKRQTIQVTKAGHIVQCRGKLNRFPNAAEFSILERWVRQAGLVISSHVKVV